MGSTDISMPALSSTMTEGKIVSWNKAVGDKVEAGEVLLIVESDKADMDVESYEDGYLAAIYTPEGESANVGAAVAVLVDSLDEIGSVGSAPVSHGGAQVLETGSDNAAPVATAPALSSDAIQVLMPALSSTMTEGRVVSWAKQPGDQVEAGEVLLVIESDKADMEFESYDDGYLAAILVEEGDTTAVGSPVALLAATKDTIDSVAAQASSAGNTHVTSPASAPVAVETTSTTTAFSPSSGASASSDGHISASGFAKLEAKAAGIDLKTVTASRSDGYITSKDLASGTPGSAPKPVYTPAPGVIHATPMARKAAKDNKLDISKIQGTGTLNRVTKDDVLKAAGKYVEPTLSKKELAAIAAAKASTTSSSSTVSVGDDEALDGEVPMDGMQKAVAKNMEATLNVPIFRVSREIYTEDFDALYGQLKPMGVTVSAMLAKAVAMTLKKYPIMNAGYVPGGIKYNKDANIAMAVAIDGGLITPTIVGAQNMDLFAISKKWKELVGKAKEKKLSPAEYSTGTFTISNLGMFGVQQFDAILPPGQGSILAIAASTPKVIQTESGEFKTKKSMTVTITCDHRHIYGADAASFLKDLANLIENESETLPWASGFD